MFYYFVWKSGIVINFLVLWLQIIWQFGMFVDLLCQQKVYFFIRKDSCICSKLIVFDIVVNYIGQLLFFVYDCSVNEIILVWK